MNNIVVQVNNVKYLVRYQVLKSVVSRKHTTKEGKVITRNELHPNSVVVYLYQLKQNTINANTLLHLNTRKKLKEAIYHGALIYLGRGLSKCSDKDKFDKNKGIRQAIANIKELDSTEFDVFLAHDINYRILNTKL